MRQETHTYTWIHSLLNLATYGIRDSASVVKKWNQQAASKNDQLLNVKSQAVKNGMELDPELLELFQPTVKFFGWRYLFFSLGRAGGRVKPCKFTKCDDECLNVCTPCGLDV